MGYLNIVLLISLMGIPFLTFFPDYVSVISTSKGIVSKCLFCIAMCDWLKMF